MVGLLGAPAQIPVPAAPRPLPRCKQSLPHAVPQEGLVDYCPVLPNRISVRCLGNGVNVFYSAEKENVRNLSDLP